MSMHNHVLASYESHISLERNVKTANFAVTGEHVVSSELGSMAILD
jgi:hypothetical protein